MCCLLGYLLEDACCALTTRSSVLVPENCGRARTFICQLCDESRPSMPTELEVTGCMAYDVISNGWLNSRNIGRVLFFYFNFFSHHYNLFVYMHGKHAVTSKISPACFMHVLYIVASNLHHESLFSPFPLRCQGLLTFACS